MKNFLYALAIATQREERAGIEPVSIVRWTLTYLVEYTRFQRIPREHFRSIVEEALKP